MSENPTYEELEKRNRELEHRIRELESAESETKQMLAALLQKEKRYQNLFENMLHEVHVWELVFDDTGNIESWKLVEANPAALKSWDKRLSEIIGKTSDEIFPNSNATELFMPIVKKIFAEDTPHIWEEYFPDTNQILQMVSIPFGDYFISTGLDITENKQAEEERRKSDERFRIAQEMSPEGFTILQPVRDDQDRVIDFTWVYENEAVARMNGTDPQKVVGQRLLELFPGHHGTQFFNAYKQVAETGKPITFEEGYVGETIKKKTWFRIVVVPMVEDIAILNQDITERKQAEEELKNERKLLNSIVNQIPVMLTRYDPNAKMLFLNREFERLVGWKTEEVQDIDMMEKVYPDPEYRQKVHEYMQKASTEWKKFNVQSKSGKIIESEWSNIKLEDGTQIGIGIDVTERKQKEREALILKAAIDQAPVGIALADENIRIYYCNPEGLGMRGGDLDNLVEIPKDAFKNWQVYMLNGEPYEIEDLPLVRAMKKGQVIREEFIVKHQDGSNHICDAFACPVLEKGKIIGGMVIFLDITDRRETEKKITFLETRNQALLDHSPVCHKIVDLDFNLQYMSDSGFKMLKIDHNADVYGKPYPFYFFPEPFKKAMIEKLTMVKATGEATTLEALTNDINKNDVWLNSSLIPVFNEKEQIDFITVVSDDVTGRKQEEKEKELIEMQLQQVQKMESVGNLAGGVAHDFNNMLGVILGHTELALLQADENHDLYSDLKEIQKAAKRSADITKQLLAFARKQTISPRKLDLNDTVESMLNMLRRLIGEDIDLVWQPATHIWPVKMDPSQIDQILANLCINARDAIAGVGKLTIETGIKTFDEEYCSQHPDFIPGDFVLLAVNDNGCGMDKDTLDNMFEPFFTTKDVGKGTGLGLATIYGIVKQNNGFINVYSESGQGSTFKIYLPRLVAEEDTDKAIPDKKAAAGGTETILLVEDEPSILKITRMMLERKGYSILRAATPGEAINLAKTHADKIHLLMTDVVMPEMNGRDLAGQITDLYPDIRLLFMSGYTANVIAHQGVLDDGVAFIQKPFSMPDMTKKVREVLDNASDKD